MKYHDITASLVNAAVDLYLRHAYDDAVQREAHGVHFENGLDPEAILSRFDRPVSMSSETAPAPSLSSHELRLGSESYPHMKLVLGESFFSGEYVFHVDRHDSFNFRQAKDEDPAWLDLMAHNYGVKKAIESAWYEAGIPTLRQLKEKRLSESDMVRAFSGRSILVVDNDHDALDLLRLILSTNGYDAVTATTLYELDRVLASEAANACGIALLDVLLADGTGLDALKRIRSHPCTKEMPIVLISALPESDVDTTGADAYLRKPFAGQDLIATVTQLVRTDVSLDLETQNRTQPPSDGV